jgi:hypothetical protein
VASDAAKTPPTVADEDSRYSRERILDPTEGPAIVGHIDSLGRTVKHAEIVGALYGDDHKTFTAAAVREAVEAFLKREIPADQGA